MSLSGERDDMELKWRRASEKNQTDCMRRVRACCVLPCSALPVLPCVLSGFVVFGKEFLRIVNVPLSSHLFFPSGGEEKMTASFSFFVPA